MVSDNQLLEEASYISGGATSAEAEKKFGLSRKTLQTHMNVLLKAKSDAYDGSGDINWKELYDLVNAQKQRNMQRSKIVPTDSQLLKISKFIIAGATFEETEKEFSISQKTLQSFIDEYLKAKSDAYDDTCEINWKELYDLVIAQKEKNMQQGRIKGGTLGHRASALSQDDLEKIARIIIHEDFTLREIVEHFGPLFEMEGKSISKSSISEELDKLDNKELLLRAKLRLAKHTLRKSDLEKDMKPEKWMI